MLTGICAHRSPQAELWELDSCVCSHQALTGGLHQAGSRLPVASESTRQDKCKQRPINLHSQDTRHSQSDCSGPFIWNSVTCPRLLKVHSTAMAIQHNSTDSTPDWPHFSSLQVGPPSLLQLPNESSCLFPLVLHRKHLLCQASSSHRGKPWVVVSMATAAFQQKASCFSLECSQIFFPLPQEHCLLFSTTRS